MTEEQKVDVRPAPENKVEPVQQTTVQEKPEVKPVVEEKKQEPKPAEQPETPQ